MSKRNYEPGGPKCQNSEAGWYNQECGKPAKWAGYQPRREPVPQGEPREHVQFFCADCAEHGRESCIVVHWKEFCDGYLAPTTEAPEGRVLCPQCRGVHHWYSRHKLPRVVNCMYCHGSGTLPGPRGAPQPPSTPHDHPS